MEEKRRKKIRREDYLFIRVTAEEKARWKAAADRLGLSLSDHIRLLADGAIRPPDGE